jgi:hypothetical protein
MEKEKPLPNDFGPTTAKHPTYIFSENPKSQIPKPLHSIQNGAVMQEKQVGCFVYGERKAIAK